MKRKSAAIPAALALVACAALLFTAQCARRGDDEAARSNADAPPGFVSTRGASFVVDGKPFRFVGANVAVMYGEDERARMPETLRAAASDGITVIRVWAFGEVDASEGQRTAGAQTKRQTGAQARRATSELTKRQTRGVAVNDWLAAGAFRRGADGWNEAAFAHLDRVLVEAARNHLRIQICLVNWWPDTGGVTKYLEWAGVRDAYDEAYPHRVNVERAMLFYSNEETRRLYRQHAARILTRRNSLTGTLYRDDPTILGYELMNEAQAPTGRAEERRAWVEEMSSYLKSLDAHHLVTPGLWGFRNSFERREWLAAHSLASVDYCDTHVYPRDDTDAYAATPEALAEFVRNRAAAALSLGKPLVFGEFGIPSEGFAGRTQADWFRAYFDIATRDRLGGAMFWIWTHYAERLYAVTYTSARDEATRAELSRAARLFAAHADDASPADLLDAGRHLIPRQFAFARKGDDLSAARPQSRELEDDGGGVLYRFAPEQAARGRFEKLGGGAGYVWGDGVGYFEYVVPARADWRRVGEIVVRAYLQPTPPKDAAGRISLTRVKLFVNGTDCGARLVALEQKPHAHVEEWRVRSISTLIQAARGQTLTLRFAVEVDADQPFGLTIANYPEGFDAHDAAPVEVELR